MTKRRLPRIAALALLGLAALGLLGYAFRPAEPASLPRVEEDAAAFGGSETVIAAIDAALGREGAGSVQAATAPLPPVTKPADASRSGATSGSPPVAAPGTLARPDQPVREPTDLPATTAQDGRKIVQTASLRLQVKDVGDSFGEVGRIASEAGGFVAGSNFANQGEAQLATVSIRVPAARYQDVLRQLRALGVKVESEGSNASDVTEEYSDLGARLRTLEATEDQLLQLLARAQNVAEVLQVQDRLNSVRTEIERVKGRIALLDRLTDLATINVHLRRVAAPGGDGRADLGAEIAAAWKASLDFLAGIAAGVLTVVVFAWWLPLVAVPAVAVGSRWWRARGRPLEAMD
jgi:hypothetical protein